MKKRIFTQNTDIAFVAAGGGLTVISYFALFFSGVRDPPQYHSIGYIALGFLVPKTDGHTITSTPETE
ncbi:hypothetical protein C6501_04915 [Candidatus Poribacteria bacterium]|nr:MAG: hypothetical protein C6501_04915 [Candidatus Poribacteria bacterium]